jgi:hypothetical protein
MPSNQPTQAQALTISATRDEIVQVRHAAKLRRMPVAEYIKRALNAQMRHEGVDAVLFAVKERPCDR